MPHPLCRSQPPQLAKGRQQSHPGHSTRFADMDGSGTNAGAALQDAHRSKERECRFFEQQTPLFGLLGVEVA